MQVNRFTIRLKNEFFYEVLVVAFFLAVHFDYIQRSNITLGIRYGISVMCFLIPLLMGRIQVNKSLIFLSILIGISGIANILVIGNATFFKVIYTIMSLFIAGFFLNESVSEQPFLISSYINILVIFLKYLSTGSMSQIYANASENYVSILLLISLTLYYVKCEALQVNMNLLPSILTFALCIMAEGRGGILTSGILLGMLIIIKIRTSEKNSKTRKLLRAAVIFSALVCIAWYIPMAMNSSFFARLFGRFGSLGFSDHGRYVIWEHYFFKVNESFANIFLGGPLAEIPIVVHYEGNLHNSFLNIHAYNGILLFTIVVVITIKSLYFGIKERRWVFIACLSTIIIRGFTDQMLWGTIGTPVFAFFLLYKESIIKKGVPVG